MPSIIYGIGIHRKSNGIRNEGRTKYKTIYKNVKGEFTFEPCQGPFSTHQLLHV